MLSGMSHKDNTVQINEFSFILQPAESRGIGIFASHDIPAGTIIQFFPDGFQHRILNKKDIPKDFLKYCVAQDDEHYKCPQNFGRMEIVWYINHAASANIIRIRPGVCMTKKDIKKGEEITLNYNELNEPEHLKESYYK